MMSSLYRFLPVSIPFLLLAAVLFPGCRNMVEAYSAYCGVVYILDEDLTELGSIEINEPPGCIQMMPGCILVATTEGNLLKYDSESFNLMGEYHIGPASVDGYSEMIPRTGSNQVYLIGAYGNILQIRVSDCSVQDMFSVCQIPCHLTQGGSGSDYFYLASGTTGEVMRISIENNLLAGSCDVDESVRAMACHSTDSLFLVFSNRVKMMYDAGPGVMYAVSVFFSRASCFSHVPNADYSVAVMNDSVGIVSYHLVPYSIEHRWFFENRCPVTGSARLVSASDASRAFILSSTGNETAVLTGYDHILGNVFGEIELAGVPMDIKTSSSGAVFVLTAVE